MNQAVRQVLLACGCTILLTVSLKARAGALTFSNTNFITINDSQNPPTKASPYPSTIVVTGLTNQVVTNVTLILKDFSHDYPSDVDVLLVGPQGQKALVMSEVGGNPEKFSVTNVTLTLDDDAASFLPIDAKLISGAFKPTEFSTSTLYPFPAPAPAGSSNAPCSFSMFNGTDPSGTWSLYVMDVVAGDAGSISGGWSLNVSVVPPPLHLSLSPPNLELTWPGTAQNYGVQYSTNIAIPNSWSNINTMPTLISNKFTVSVPIPSTDMFFRLIYL